MERLLRARHRDVEEPPLLLEPEVPRRGPVPEERVGQLEDIAAARPRETAPGPAPRRTRPGNSSPLALCTVRTCTAGASTSASATAGSSPASIRASRCFTNSRTWSRGRTRVASWIRRKNRATFWTSASSRARARARHPAQPAAVREELVEQLPGAELGRQPDVTLELLHQARDRLGALGGEGRAELGRLVEAAQHVEEPAVPAVGMRPAARQVDGRHREEPRGRQRVEAHRVVRDGR